MIGRRNDANVHLSMNRLFEELIFPSLHVLPQLLPKTHKRLQQQTKAQSSGADETCVWLWCPLPPWVYQEAGAWAAVEGELRVSRVVVVVSGLVVAVVVVAAEGGAMVVVMDVANG